MIVNFPYLQVRLSSILLHAPASRVHGLSFSARGRYAECGRDHIVCSSGRSMISEAALRHLTLDPKASDSRLGSALSSQLLETLLSPVLSPQASRFRSYTFQSAMIKSYSFIPRIPLVLEEERDCPDFPLVSSP